MKISDESIGARDRNIASNRIESAVDPRALEHCKTCKGERRVSKDKICPVCYGTGIVLRVF